MTAKLRHQNEVMDFQSTWRYLGFSRFWLEISLNLIHTMKIGHIFDVDCFRYRVAGCDCRGFVINNLDLFVSELTSKMGLEFQTQQSLSRRSQSSRRQPTALCLPV